jgi:zinc-ribbon domain
MFCPNCGKDNTATKKFCTSCGLKLQTIAQFLTIEQSENREADKQVKSRRMQNAVMTSFSFIFLGIIISLIGRDAFENQLITDLGAIVAILGMGLVVYRGIQNSNRSKPVQNSQANRPTVETVELLPLPIAEPISITENTTRELDLSFASKKKISHQL